MTSSRSRVPGAPVPEWLAENLISDAVWVLLGATARSGYQRVRASLQPDPGRIPVADGRAAALYRARLALPAADTLHVVLTEHRSDALVVTIECVEVTETVTLVVMVARDRQGHLWGRVDREVRGSLP